MLSKMVLIAAVMTVIVAIKFVAIAAPPAAIVANGITNIGCTTKCLLAELCCIAAGCSPVELDFRRIREKERRIPNMNSIENVISLCDNV